MSAAVSSKERMKVRQYVTQILLKIENTKPESERQQSIELEDLSADYEKRQYNKYKHNKEKYLEVARAKIMKLKKTLAEINTKPVAVPRAVVRAVPSQGALPPYAQPLDARRRYWCKIEDLDNKYGNFLKGFLKTLHKHPCLHESGNTKNKDVVKKQVKIVKGCLRILRERESTGKYRGIKHSENMETYIIKTYEMVQRYKKKRKAERGEATAPSLAPQTVKRVKSHHGAQECAVCMVSRTSHVFVPCGHLCVCAACAGAIQKTNRRCPLCRKVGKVMKVYFN